MPLETGTYISDLVATNPVGATDTKAQGDDHIRLIKSTVKATFPNVTGAVTGTQAQINAAVSLLNTDPDADTIFGWDDSAGVAIGFTLVSGELLTTGTTLGVGSNVPLLNAANVFTAAQTIQAAQVRFLLTETGATAEEGHWELRADADELNLFANTDAGAANDTVIKLTRAGATVDGMQLLPNGALSEITLASVAASDFARLSQSNTFTGATQLISAASGQFAINDSAIEARFRSSGSLVQVGTNSAHTLDLITNATARIGIDSAGALDFKSGSVTTANDTADEVGYKGIPSADDADNYTFVLTDAGRAVRYTGTGGHTFTIPANASVAFPVGTVLTIINDGGGGSPTLSIALTTDTLVLGGTGSTGTRTLALNGVATALKTRSNQWVIQGTGLS